MATSVLQESLPEFSPCRQQAAIWAPIVVTAGGEPLQGGLWTCRLMWFELLFGWGASLLLVAVLSNLVKKD